MTKLSDKFFPFFEEAGTKTFIRAGSILYMQDDTASDIYLVISGRVRMFYIGENGKEVTYRIIGDGQLIGEAAFLSHLQQATVSAVTDTVMIACPLKSLYPYIAEHDELNRIIFELLTENYIQLCSQLRRLTVSDSRRRIAGFLIDMTETDHEDLGIIDHTLPYTQEELSVCLNLHRTTVSRVLSDFSKQGLVRLGYGKIQLADIDGLRSIII